MRSGHNVAPGNLPLFEEIAEAAEVLLDGGQGDAYTAAREELLLGQAAAGEAEALDAHVGRHLHRLPMYGAPAAADEPPVPGGCSLPPAERQSPEAARGAALGFAEQAGHDAEEERREGAALPPPQVRQLHVRV